MKTEKVGEENVYILTEDEFRVVNEFFLQLEFYYGFKTEPITSVPKLIVGLPFFDFYKYEKKIRCILQNHYQHC